MHRTSIGRLDSLSTHFCLYKDICICVCTYESIGKYNWFMIWFFIIEFYVFPLFVVLFELKVYFIFTKKSRIISQTHITNSNTNTNTSEVDTFGNTSWPRDYLFTKKFFPLDGLGHCGFCTQSLIGWQNILTLFKRRKYNIERL